MTSIYLREIYDNGTTLTMQQNKWTGIDNILDERILTEFAVLKRWGGVGGPKI